MGTCICSLKNKPWQINTEVNVLLLSTALLTKGFFKLRQCPGPAEMSICMFVLMIHHMSLPAMMLSNTAVRLADRAATLIDRTNRTPSP